MTRGLSDCGWRAPPVQRTRGTDRLWDDFTNCYKPRDRRGWGDGWSAPLGNWEGEDYSDVFVSHAKMAVLADYHGVPALEMLACEKLTSVLSSFKLWAARVGDVARLICYIYENTPQLNCQSGLRQLVCQYAACKMEELWKCDEFKAAFETYIDFAKELTEQLLKRL